MRFKHHRRQICLVLLIGWVFPTLAIYAIATCCLLLYPFYDHMLYFSNRILTTRRTFYLQYSRGVTSFPLVKNKDFKVVCLDFDCLIVLARSYLSAFSKVSYCHSDPQDPVLPKFVGHILSRKQLRRLLNF